MQRRIAALVPALLFTLVTAAPRTAGAEEGGVIRGLLYVSPAGDLSSDVMYGRDVDVLALKGGGNMETELKALREERIPRIRIQEQAALKAAAEVRKAQGIDKEREEERRAIWKREEEALTKVRSEYSRDVDGLLTRYAVSRTRTDQEGRFEFRGLAAGRYLLHARFEVLRIGVSYAWLLPVELKAGEEKAVQLNKPAAVALYD